MRPPVPLALAKAVSRIPPENALPGGCLYEPKWDGFRLALLTEDDGVSLWSRQGKNLSRYFPELVAAANKQIPPGFLIDGEAVIWSEGRLDFDALQQRMTASKTNLAPLAVERPASFAAFDLLTAAHYDTRGVPLSQRRELLEALSSEWDAPLALSPTTRDKKLAEQWFAEMPATGIEGLVVKGASQLYEGGQRQWLKVKHRDVIDVVCGAVIGSRTEPTAIVAGLPLREELVIVGRSTALSTKTARVLAQHLSPPASNHPWPEQISHGALDRFSKDKGPVALTLVEPIVVEVAADVAWSGRSFRHPLRFRRVRPELQPLSLKPPKRE